VYTYSNAAQEGNKMKIVDTENKTAQPGWFAVNDIAQRAAAAYDSAPELYDAQAALADEVEALMRKHSKLYRATYQTCRKATRKQAGHTEVKIDKVEFNPGLRAALVVALELKGIAHDDITYKPATQSMSVRVK